MIDVRFGQVTRGKIFHLVQGDTHIALCGQVVMFTQDTVHRTAKVCQRCSKRATERVS